MSTWVSPVPPPRMGAPGAAGWARALLRGVPLAVLIFGGLGLLLLVRLVERPLCGMARPVTPWISRAVCRAGLALLGLRYRVEGRPMRRRGAAVANHVGWLDILALNAGQAVFFVAKAEVAGWPGIGWLARATGAVFIARDPRQAKMQEAAFRARLLAGHHLLFFPEGTSTDGLRLLPFKSTLFAAFLHADLRDALHVQPVSLRYAAPRGADPRFYGWWGNMDLAPHLLAVLAAPRQGGVTVCYHPPLRVADYPDRKALAAACARAVQDGLRAV